MDRLTKNLKGYLGRKIIASLLVRCLLLNPSVNALALDATDVISSSGAVPAQWENHTVINTQQGTIIDRSNFNTNPAQRITFDQSIGAVQSSASAALNRVNSGSVPTVFEGSLTVNGRIFVVNPTGIIFGAESPANGHTGILAATPSAALSVGTENAQMEHQESDGQPYHTVFAEAVIICKPASDPDHYLKNPDPNLPGPPASQNPGVKTQSITPFIAAVPLPKKIELGYSSYPALITWASKELGMDKGAAMDIWLANALVSSRDIQPYEMYARLWKAASILQDEKGFYTAALRRLIDEFTSSTMTPTEEQMAFVVNAIANNTESNNDYDVAGQYLEALIEYVDILDREVGLPTNKAIELVTARYVNRLGQGNNVRIMPFITARLSAMRGQ